MELVGSTNPNFSIVKSLAAKEAANKAELEMIINGLSNASNPKEIIDQLKRRRIVFNNEEIKIVEEKFGLVQNEIAEPDKIIPDDREMDG